MFCEPASAASVAGLLKYGADGAEQIVCVLTGRGLKDPETAIANNDGTVISVRAAEMRRRSRKRCWADPASATRRVVRVPASSANLGPGLRLHGRRARRCTSSSRSRRRGSSRSRPTCRSPRGRENLCVRAFERLHPADGFTFRIRSEIPLSGGLGSSAAAIVAGLMAADHLFELDADLLALASELEGHPDNVAAALLRRLRRSAPTAQADALRPADGPRGARGRARARRCARAPRARRCPQQVPIADAVFNVAHGALLTLGLATRRLGPARRAACTTACTSSAARTCSRARPSWPARARELGALGATISGAGPTVLVWCFYEQTGAVAEALAGEIEGWASVLRASFEPQGAYVGRALRRARAQARASRRARRSRPGRRSSSSSASAR